MNHKQFKAFVKKQTFGKDNRKSYKKKDLKNWWVYSVIAEYKLYKKKLRKCFELYRDVKTEKELMEYYKIARDAIAVIESVNIRMPEIAHKNLLEERLRLIREKSNES